MQPLPPDHIMKRAFFVGWIAGTLIMTLSLCRAAKRGDEIAGWS